MSDLFIVTGEGPNGLKIPLVPFSTREEAEAFIDQFPKHPTQKGWLDEDFSEVMGIYYDEDDNECHSAVGKPLYNALFLNGYYYSGCGGCYALTIIEADFGKPMVGWDLD